MADKAKSKKSDLEQIKEKAQPFFASRPEVLFVYLFGSVAADQNTISSDLDLALYLDSAFQKPSTGYGYQSELITELSAILGTTTDVVILNKAALSLKFQVINKGILIYNCADQARRDFHEKAVREYLDFKPFLEVQAQYLKKRLREKTFGGGRLVDKELVLLKLQELDRYLTQLKKHHGLKTEQLDNNLDQSWIIQHGLQLSIQLVLDIGNHILAAAGEPAQDYSKIFEKLAQIEVLPADFAQSIKSMAGLRNILIYEYTAVDMEKLADLLNNRLDDFSIFADHVMNYLEKE